MTSLEKPERHHATRILCVDDEPVMRDLLALHLRRHGYEVEIAPDGRAAWHLVAQDPSRFDVVITDNQMPHMTGIALAEKLRAKGFSGGIVFFSSTLTSQSAEQLASVRIDALVEKGRPLSELLTAVHHAAGRK